MSGTIINAKNPSNQFVPLTVDSNNRLECSVNEIELTAESINLNVNDLETLTTAGNNTLSSIDNKVILPSALDGDRLKTITTGTVSATISGVSTEAKQDSIISTIGDTNSKIDAMRGSNSITDLATKLNAGLPSALDSDRLKVILDANLADTNSKIDAMRGSNSITDLATKLNAGLPSALDSDRLKCVLDANLADTNSKIDTMRASDTLTTVKNAIDTVATNTSASATDLAALEVLVGDLSKAEDSAHSGGDKGIQILSVRKDVATNLGGSDADYQPLITDANGRLHGINRTAVENSSETSYVSGQSISGSGTFTGSAIAVDPNTRAFFAEFNFSHTGIKFEILGSIDGTNFFSSGVEFNAGGMSPATLTGLETILGTSTSIASFPPHIKFKFTNSDSSAQSATLSYVQQIG